MIHPQTCVKYVNGQIGYGVYATGFIPKGTIVYVRDPLEMEVSPDAFTAMDECYRQVTEKYSFIDDRGYRVVSWDSAKYVNHCCNFNTISAGYGFEIAVRDIESGEEVTDEYGLFNLDHDMLCCCGSDNCRKAVRASDVERYYRKWDRVVTDALVHARRVDQPLWVYMDVETKNNLCDYFEGRKQYVSVRNLKAATAARSSSVPVTIGKTVALGRRRAAAV